MPKLKISIPHKLGQEDAKQRLENMIKILKDQYKSNVEDIHEEWNDYNGSFSFRVMGLPVDGNMVIEPSNVHVEGYLPIAAMPFKNKIENTIREQMSVLLS